MAAQQAGHIRHQLPPNRPRTSVAYTSPRVQVPNNHILSKNPNLHNKYPKAESSLLGPLDPWGFGCQVAVYAAPRRPTNTNHRFRV